jgi:hypothetical protein
LNAAAACPGFVLTDLTVEEDPVYGAEPILRANTVNGLNPAAVAVARTLEIGTISVDEASLNVVRTSEGRWNLDSLFRTAAEKAQPAGGRRRAKPEQACGRRCPTWRQPTPASTSSEARRSCRFRWWTPTFLSGRSSRATGASGCAASRLAPT